MRGVSSFDPETNTKVCAKCVQRLPIEMFGKMGKRTHSYCRACAKERDRAYIKARPDIVAKKNAKWRLKPENRAFANMLTLAWRKRNIEHVNALRRIAGPSRLSRSKNAAIANRLVTKVWQAFTKNIGRSSIEKLVGCRMDELRAHLESQFQAGMTWQNYGKGGWVIDHHFPLSKSFLLCPLVRQKAFHYTNLRPLWERDNLKKHNKIVVDKLSL